MEQERASRGSEVLSDRVWLIGEGVVPMEVFEEMSDETLRIFLEEPDPENWPPEMQSLKAYLQKEP